MCNSRIVVMLCTLGLLTSGCSKIVYYEGQTLQPTKQVAVFESVLEIGKEHYIFGEMEVRSTFKAGIRTLRGRAVKEAKKRGADAIVIVERDTDAERDSRFYHPSSIRVTKIQVFLVKYGAKPDQP